VQKNKSIIKFLLKFFGTYAVLFVFYSLYLDVYQDDSSSYTCAPITQNVANLTKHTIDFFGYNAEVKPHNNEFSIKILVNNKFVARVIEGCNAVSIIILFVSFVIAFSNRFLPTLLFLLVGSALIYGINVLRIALITLAIYKFPQYQNLLHTYVFPVIIYGFTFLLWIIWIKYFAFKK